MNIRTACDMDETMGFPANGTGHAPAGCGHPDQETGPAPLPGANRAKRLMFSGSGALLYHSARLLVKGEWDEAEKWLTANIKDKEE